jgi:hypothetical protein
MINSRNDVIELLREYTITQREYKWNINRPVAFLNGVVLGKFRENDCLKRKNL